MAPTPTTAVTPNQTSLNMTNNPTSGTPEIYTQAEIYPVLLAINCVVLIISFIGLSQMWQMIDTVKKQKSRSVSATVIAMFNLIFAHFVYFITVPFRIYYYATGTWGLTIPWCKIVSSMIFIHIFMSFIFYCIIIVLRLLTYRKTPVEIYRTCHAVCVCVCVWLLVLVAVPCVVYFKYGIVHGEDDSKCFHFGSRIAGELGAKAFNYVMILLIVVATLVLVVLQTRVQYQVGLKDWRSQQEFWRQLKSSLFVLIMVVCFLPYTMFRLHYIENTGLTGGQLENINEVFLSLTTLNCLDMFTFVRLRCNTCCN